MGLFNWLGIEKKQDNTNQDLSENAKYDPAAILSDWETSQYNLSLYNPYNPDPLVLKKTLNIYDEMYSNDEQLRSLLKLKKHFIIGNGYSFKNTEIENEANNEIIDFLYYMIESSYKGMFNDSLMDVLSSFQFGFSVSEIILNQCILGKYKGKILLDKIKTRPPHGFEFHLNKKGDIINLQQNAMWDIKKYLPIKKFLIYTNDSQFGTPYGISDLKPIYGWYMLKQMLIKYAAISAERFSMPYAVGSVPKGTPTAQREVFLNVLKKMQAKGVMVKDDDKVVELLSSSTAGNMEFYKNMIELCGNHYAKSFLLPELLGFSTHENGSEALGRQQFDIFMSSVAKPEQQRFSDLLNEKIFKPIIDLNFGEQECYPYFEFNDIKDDNMQEMVKTWILAVEKGVVKNTIEDENLVREKLGYPEREEDEIDIESTMPIEVQIDNPDDIKPTEEIKSDVIEEVCSNDKKEMAEIKDDIKFRRPLTQFEEKVSLNTIKNDIEIQEKEMALNLFKVIDDIKTELENKIIKQKIVDNKKFNLINELSISENLINYLKNTFSNSLNSTYKVAKQIAKDDAIKTTEFLEKQYTIGAIEPKESIKYLQAKAISLTGTEEEFILKNVKNILMDGLKNGKTQSQVLSNLEDFFKTYSVGQLNSKGEIQDINEIEGRLVTVVRTNLNDAYNQGRMALYNDKDVKEFIEALQYSAIMDDVTTDFCAEMDGKIFLASDSIWDWATPPNNFNCRSLLIAIFVGEQFEVSEYPTLRPMDGFGG